MKIFSLGACLPLVFILSVTPYYLGVEAQDCKPSGKIRGRKLPPGECNQDDSDCCVPGKLYPTYRCSHSVSSNTKAVLTLNGFSGPVDGDFPSQCDNRYHSEDELIVALSTGWFNGGRRCLNNVTISANGRIVHAIVVDECDSTVGCDADTAYQPPCANDVVAASEGVWKALGVPIDDWGQMDITWSIA
ncbi:hypothetical protein RJ639_039304 [Escallonia herrerae]|uniref:Ripening-related protein 1 n=1 Tax=Escallonia herrerae TaxID=1293975 RepID=A0AA88WMS0_9ASTE|nr:hypothetical protein RJ639_039304 [Escallonia herrerae]